MPPRHGSENNLSFFASKLPNLSIFGVELSYCDSELGYLKTHLKE